MNTQQKAAPKGRTPTPGRLELKAPNKLLWWSGDDDSDEDGVATIGATVFVLLDALMKAPKNRVTIKAACRAVWGEEKVKVQTLWSICHRASLKLAEAGSPHRVGVDFNDVVLV